MRFVLFLIAVQLWEMTKIMQGIPYPSGEHFMGLAIVLGIFDLVDFFRNKS